MKIVSRYNHREGQGYAAVAEGIAGGQEARARTRQGDHVAHPAVEGLQKSFRQEEGKGQGHDGLHLRRPVRRRLDHELPRVLAHGHQNNQAVFELKGKPLKGGTGYQPVLR